MDIHELYRGVEILDRYRPEGDYWNVASEHDELFLPGLPPEEMDPRDVKDLEALGYTYMTEFTSWQHYT